MSADASNYDEHGHPVPEVDPLASLRSGAWLDAQTFPPMSWAVPGLIPEGFGLFTGPPKAGKSWASLDIGLAVASGGRALGKVETGPPRPVLLFALEDGYRRLQGRCRHLLGEGAPIPDRLDVNVSARPHEVATILDAWLDEHGDAEPLVILDTLGKVLPPKSPGESDYQRDYRIGARLKLYVDERPGSTLLAVHHTRKATSDDWMDSTSGTNGLNGAADWTVNLSRSRNEDAGLLRVTGRDVPEGEHAITSSSGRWTLDGEDLAEASRRAAEVRASSGLSDLSSRIVRVVSEHPEGIGPKAVGEAVDITTEQAGQYLGRLVNSKRIEKAGRGLYTPFVPYGELGELESSPPPEQLSNSPLSPPLPKESCPLHGGDLAPDRCMTCEELSKETR